MAANNPANLNKRTRKEGFWEGTQDNFGFRAYDGRISKTKKLVNRKFWAKKDYQNIFLELFYIWVENDVKRKKK